MELNEPDHREQRKEAQRVVEILTNLVKSEGWDYLKTAIENQLELLKREILINPLNGDNNVYVQEFNKGQFNGLTIALKLPQTMIDGNLAVFSAIPPSEEDDE